MRKTVYYLAFALCITAPTITNGAFVIRLKNGNEYVTNRYWQEGAQVLFDADGGIFGVDKAFVHKIEKTDKVIKLATTAPQDPAEAPQREAASEKSEREAIAQAPAIKERLPDDPIVGELTQLKKKANEVDGMLTSEIRELLNNITAFKNKILKDSKVFIDYGREFNDLQELGSSVESALTSRSN